VRVQVSRVDLDGRKIDFRLVREGEELVNRAMKEKGVVANGGNGVPAKASAKRAARKTAPVADRGARSPIQSLKAAVKKAATKSKSRKSRR
jgi:ribonuclease R